MVLSLKKVDETDLTVSLLIASLAMFFLIFIMGMTDFTSYFFEKIIWLIIMAFFLVPIIKIITTQKFDRKNTVPLLIGFSLSWFYTLFYDYSIIDWCILMLKSLIVISFLSFILTYFKEELSGS